MSATTTAKGPVFDEWMADLGALLNQAEAWAREEGWPTRREEVSLAEQQFGHYQAPALVMESPWGEVWLEPVGRNVIGGKGRVDLMAYPSGARVMLIRSFERDAWCVKTDSIILKEPWEKETLQWLSKALHHG